MAHSANNKKLDKTAATTTLDHLNSLANKTVPAGLNDLLAGIDTMLANAQHTIDSSLQQSAALIEHSRQQLQQFEQQQDPHQSNGSGPSKNVLGHDDYTLGNTTPQPGNESAGNILTPSFTTQQTAALEAAQTAQQTMDDAIKQMQQQLLAQSKHYEASVAKKVASHEAHNQGPQPHQAQG
ncbi:hypothetical protein PCIT_b1183 [Pseudoalteromonas citrea]|uniref:Uncharacterized protein n=2 Tax=Pseudoalteromonas citrea TaxID=43655 RepID=A0AAD4FQI7_9GAMM|nr:hypothetical protein [Pseudoalteromonas citrea]KAF7765049.1 hypothetical protein PCIT_b1183 [Pseudoalteromonas citrea]